ncbi:TonB family protein [Rhodocytophaga aerolata]|uniref:TonB family protein n=2 Tax=Rhodocytophaga aerolata TaxID=455078 RepID=A0ABT8R7Y3_9BACT|nr:energy transducer TonB [Rhodocytophaga aerolata]MDO1448069.1 TonB family protein [Rhodocytophaga aerolata]
MQNQDPVPDDEIRSYQSFDKLLRQHKQVLWKKMLYRKLAYGTATVSIIIASLVYYLPDTPQQKPVSSLSPAAVQPSSKPQLPGQKTAAATSTPSTDTLSPGPARTPVTTAPIKKDVVNPTATKKIAEKKEATLQQKEAEGSFVAASPTGGYYQLFDYFQQSLRYPRQAREDSITGTVIIGFAINAEGKPQDLQVIKSVHPALDEEALRLVTEMPGWIPALLNGKPITTRQTVPLTFQLITSQK